MVLIKNDASNVSGDVFRLGDKHKTIFLPKKNSYFRFDGKNKCQLTG